jgi:hypothetical protein
VRYPKHLQVKKDWNKVIPSTKHGPAKYRISAAEVQRQEMATLAPDTNTGAPIAGTELDRLPDDTVRCFWRHVGFEIGASRGRRTEYILVSWHLDGSVHGQPISEEELIDMGANL